jgi:plasmid maintenance system antidote protein VapI
VSVAEIAELLGVTRQRVNQLMHEREDFPAPLAELAIGRVWQRKDIESWAKTLPRRPGRRKPTTT